MTCEDDAGLVTVYVAELSPSEVLANWTIARTMAEQQPVSGAPWLFWWMNQPEP